MRNRLRAEEVLDTGLGLSWEYRPDINVIGAFILGLEGLFEVMRGCADKQVGGYLSCLGKRQVLTTEVHPVRFDCNGNIHTVIYDEQHAGFCGTFPETFGQPEKVPFAEVFFPELNDPRPTFNKAAQYFQIRPAVGKPLTCDGIDIDCFKEKFSLLSDPRTPYDIHLR